ncbi:MAG: hypothetical protein KGI06_00625 [Candidatus Micrarchaeota archaeon]|nr:hypothetical protein [Candidatus Micrarchaeota archaeon]
MSKLDSDIKSITKHLTQKQKDFDRVMALVRDIIRNSAQAITMLHNNDAKSASKIVSTTLSMVKELKKFAPAFAHNAKQAYQEYAEARILLGIKLNHEIPTCAETGVDQESYLMGLMDVMGELKREVFESLGEGRVDEADEYFRSMRTIYDSTRSVRFAEAVLNGFRRKQDVARIQLESAGSEILSFKPKKR